MHQRLALGIGTATPTVKLHIDGGADASLSAGSGYLLVNTEDSTNIVIDDNEIMARNNGAASPLYMQADGGDFSVHANVAGTQLIVKGHDLPKLSLVSILLAEDSLKFPDFSSEERSFQLLHQVSGRVGRGHGAGKIIVQTYGKDTNRAFVSEQKNSWEAFYEQELLSRKQFGFPPFSYLLKVEVARATDASAEKAALQLHQLLKDKTSDELEILDPSPSFFAKRAGKWHWQVVVKAKKRSSLINLLEHVPKTATTDLDPSTLL